MGLGGSIDRHQINTTPLSHVGGVAPTNNNDTVSTTKPPTSAPKQRGIAGIKNPILKNVALSLGAFATSARTQISSFATHINPMNHVNKQMNEKILGSAGDHGAHQALTRPGDVKIQRDDGGSSFLMLKQDKETSKYKIQVTLKGVEVDIGKGPPLIFKNPDAAISHFSAAYKNRDALDEKIRNDPKSLFSADDLKTGESVFKHTSDMGGVFVYKNKQGKIEESKIFPSRQGFEVHFGNSQKTTFSNLENVQQFFNTSEAIKIFYAANMKTGEVKEQAPGEFFHSKYNVSIKVDTEGNIAFGNKLIKKGEFQKSGDIERDVETKLFELQLLADKADVLRKELGTMF